MIDRFQGRELDEGERNVLSHVEHHGWSVLNIPEEDGVAGWAFTIGFYENYGHPEVILFGLEQKNRHSLLNWIGRNVKEGNSFAAGREHDWVLKQFGCWSREADKAWYRDVAGWAMWFYGGDAFPMVQCIWPAADGSYPWESTSSFSSSQPLLYETGLLEARMLHFVGEQKLTSTEWPFPSDPHQRVFVSRCIVEDHAPITRVVHDTEGDWQFIGPVEDPDADGGKLLCFHCVVEKDPGVRSLAALKRGQAAQRNTARGPWILSSSTED